MQVKCKMYSATWQWRHTQLLRNNATYFQPRLYMWVRGQSHWQPIYFPRLGSVTHNTRGCMGPVLAETDVNQKNPLHEMGFEPRQIQSVPSRNTNTAALVPLL